MELDYVTPETAADLVKGGATLIDIRGLDEHKRERIAGAAHHPQPSSTSSPVSGNALIFHCKSGIRTRMSAPILGQVAAGRPWYVLEGGIDAWKRSGMPVIRDTFQPIELQRQVMIVAGSLILLGALLAAFASPYFIVLPLFIGAGLTFAGISGFCGMARLLMLAPWNR